MQGFSWQVAAPVPACKSTPLEVPPPLVLADGMGAQSASPPGEIRGEAQRSRLATKPRRSAHLPPVCRAPYTGPDAGLA